MSRYQRPFLKWAGGKHRLLDRLNRKLPKGDRLVEPFVGSGAVFMGTDYDSYLLADANEDLISLYSVLADEGKEFIDHASAFFSAENNTESRYYELRDQYNELARQPLELVDVDLAALFIYLNRHCFNGLIRFNARGKFNTPYGRYKRPYFPRNELLAFHQKLNERAVELAFADFTETFAEVVSGDVVYCDPPYVPLSKTASFTAYSAGGFGLEKQQRLAEVAEATAAKGIPVVISNQSVTANNNMYRFHGASLSFFNAARSVSCKGSSRRPAREVMACWRAAL